MMFPVMVNTAHVVSFATFKIWKSDASKTERQDWMDLTFIGDCIKLCRQMLICWNSDCALCGHAGKLSLGADQGLVAP